MNDRLLLGALLGVGVTLALAPVVVPPLARALRPGAKAAVKTAIVGWHRSQELLAEIKEMTEDAYAEAAMELMAEAAQRHQDQAGSATADGGQAG